MEQDGNQSRWGFRGKTFWNWLELLVVPLALAGIGFWFTAQQDIRQLEIEEHRAQGAALQAYLDQMSTLLIENDLRTSPGDSEVRTLARARTLTVLSSLGPEDKPSVLQFLYESDLILRVDTSTPTGSEIDSSPPECIPQVVLRGAEPVVSLRGADLRDVPLSGASLSGANLSGANLSGANLQDADLSSTDLSSTDLKNTNLSSAFLNPGGMHAPSQAITILQGADLSSADLSSADLSNADLCSAKLKDTELTDANLREAALIGAKGVTIDRLVKEAESLDGARMPNYRLCEELPACKGHGGT